MVVHEAFSIKIHDPIAKQNVLFTCRNIKSGKLITEPQHRLSHNLQRKQQCGALTRPAKVLLIKYNCTKTSATIIDTSIVKGYGCCVISQHACGSCKETLSKVILHYEQQSRHQRLLNWSVLLLQSVCAQRHKDWTCYSQQDLYKG